MWGDGQHPPYLAGAVDAIAPHARVHSCSHAGLSACCGPSRSSRVPQGALGGFAFQGSARVYADGPGSPGTTLAEQRKTSSFFLKKIQCFREGFGFGVREGTSGGNGLFKNKQTKNPAKPSNCLASPASLVRAEWGSGSHAPLLEKRVRVHV